MKKLILLLISISIYSNTFAQGITNTGAYDDFSTYEEYYVLSDDNGTPQIYEDDTYKGIFWWQDLETSLTNYTSVYTRIGDNKLTYSIHQPQNSYEPVGISFGIKNNGDDFTIDLTNNAEVSFSLKNISDDTIAFTVSLVDVNGVQIGFDQDALNDLNNLYQYEVGAFSEGLNYGTDTNKVIPNETVNFDYDFKQAIAAEYINGGSSLCEDQPKLICNNCFDYAKVKAVLITIVNYEALGYENCYANLEFTGSIELTEFKVGSDVVTSNNTFKQNQPEVYPNPATETINFSNKLTNIKVYNSQGILLETIGTASSINTNSYEAGVYFIKATEGDFRVFIK